MLFCQSGNAVRLNSSCIFSRYSFYNSVYDYLVLGLFCMQIFHAIYVECLVLFATKKFAVLSQKECTFLLCIKYFIKEW